MMSPNLNYFIIFNDSHKNELLDLNENKIIYTFDNDIISYCLNDESLIYYDCETKYINIYIFDKDKTITVTNFKDIIKPNLNLSFFVHDKEYYKLFIYDSKNNIPKGDLYRIKY